MRAHGAILALLLAGCAAAPAKPAVGTASTLPPQAHEGMASHAIEHVAFDMAAEEDAAAEENVVAEEALAERPRAEADPVPAEIAPRELDDEELRRLVSEQLDALPAMSVGKPNAGALVNGVRMPEGPHWEIVDPRRAYATPETIDYLITAIEAVEEEHGHLHPVWLGHFSDEDGGRLRPHRSHQSGRDVDLSYYYLPEKAEWYRPAVRGTLDVARTWTFVRALLTKTDVELILIDRRVQKMLKEHALAIGEDPAWLDSVFQHRSRSTKPIIKHTWGHRTHIHVRFYNPEAQRLGERAFDALAAERHITPRLYTVSYRARAGDTLAGLAARSGSSAEAFAKINGTSTVEPGRLYTVPMRGQVSRAHDVTVPPRRLPPSPGARAQGVAAGDL
ncbi:MAG TPA: murein endopeptidase [Polyangiaceae bacterium]|nr:murein endopeptidase [Polyangiaceae bacterium]